MTANKLHKLLTKMIADGHGRREVLVNKETFASNLEPEVQFLPISGLLSKHILMADPDGGTMTNRDGSERGSVCIVLFGASGEPDTGCVFDHETPSAKG